MPISSNIVSEGSVISDLKNKIILCKYKNNNINFNGLTRKINTTNHQQPIYKFCFYTPRALNLFTSIIYSMCEHRS